VKSFIFISQKQESSQFDEFSVKDMRN